jgi:hypothetical protein
MNSFIVTADGVAGMAESKPFTADKSHPNYTAIVEAIKAGQFNKIHGLVNIAASVAKELKKATKVDGTNRVDVDVEAGIVFFDGKELHNAVTQHIIDMLRDGFNVKPMVHFLDNLMNNPSKRVIDRIFDWMQAGKMPVTEDGCFLAFKRVRDDLKSFYDGTTNHVIGQMTSMPRYECDDNNQNTCSSGLHFCSQGYLPSYHGGQGRVLVLKINPADVVSIPVEYGTHKGRACQYFIMDELKNENRTTVETSNPIKQPVVTETTDLNVRPSFVEGYATGYDDGKKKRSKMAPRPLLYGDFNRGYDEGYKDGRGHKARRYKL